MLNNIVGDSDWGAWPNSFEGFIALGVTVEASLDGFDVDASLLDQTAPGLMLMSTQTQSGNTNCVINNVTFDVNTQTLSVDYIDTEGNLPWYKSIQVCTPNDLCFYNANIGALEHTYQDGTTFTHTFAHSYEAALNYSKKLNHGEAVILGINTALKFSLQKNYIKKSEYESIINHIKKTKISLNIRRHFSIKDLNKILFFMTKDKKNSSEKINLILLKKIGSKVFSKQFNLNNLRIFMRKELSNNYLN